MKIMITAYGLPKEVLENDRFEIELPENATVADLQERLDSEFPQLFGFRSLAMLVGEVSVSNDFKLHDGDKVFFIPPAGGG